MMMATYLHTALLAQGSSPFLSGWAIMLYAVLAAALLSLAFFKKYYMIAVSSGSAAGINDWKVRTPASGHPTPV